MDSLNSWHRIRRRLLRSRYTDADPFALRWVDPTLIERSVLESAPSVGQWGRVIGGDWDREWEPFDERDVPRGIVQRYREGRPWEETALVDGFVEQLERFGTAWGYTSMAGFDRRCAEVDHLYESIREHGYRRQESLPPDAGFDRGGSRLDEITVDVGRKGRFYWRGYGQHRLAIAKVLELESVPVLVHRRHRRWQAIRDDLRESPRSRSERELSLVDRTDGGQQRIHPDLRDCIGGGALDGGAFGGNSLDSNAPGGGSS